MTISTKGMTVFLQSIKYRYYPIFMIVLIPTMIYFKRDFGGMLISERKTQCTGARTAVMDATFLPSTSKNNQRINPKRIPHFMCSISSCPLCSWYFSSFTS